MVCWFYLCMNCTLGFNCSRRLTALFVACVRVGALKLTSRFVVVQVGITTTAHLPFLTSSQKQPRLPKAISPPWSVALQTCPVDLQVHQSVTVTGRVTHPRRRWSLNVPAGPGRRPTRSESMFLTKEENCAPENWCLCQKEQIMYGRMVKCNRASTDWVKDRWLKSVPVSWVKCCQFQSWENWCLCWHKLFTMPLSVWWLAGSSKGCIVSGFHKFLLLVDSCDE